MTPAAALFGYSPSGAVLTLVLPLGLFIVVMIAMTAVFRPGHAVPARQPAGRRAASASAATARSQPDDEDTEVHDTLVSDDVSDDPAATGTPEVPE